MDWPILAMCVAGAVALLIYAFGFQVRVYGQKPPKAVMSYVVRPGGAAPTVFRIDTPLVIFWLKPLDDGYVHKWWSLGDRPPIRVDGGRDCHFTVTLSQSEVRSLRKQMVDQEEEGK